MRQKQKMFNYIIIYFILYNVSPGDLNKYDLIIIPILKDEGINENRKPRAFHRDYRTNYDRLDIGDYEEATEALDVDSFGDTSSTLDVSGLTGSGPQRLGLDYPLGNYEEDKIVGGFEVDINLYPYHVAYGTNCGGAIIDRKWIITAGHCGKKPYIKAGSKYLNQGKKISVKNNFIHPSWTAKDKEHPFDYDFQLLELSEPLKYDDNIQAIKIAHIEDMVIGKVVTVTGWGNTEENGPYSNVLRAVRVPIISKENCQQVPFPYFRGALTPRMFCAGFSEGKKDACQGDSGGPAVASGRLLGMVSFGYGCATPGSYGVYSKVAKVRSWISQVTGLSLE